MIIKRLTRQGNSSALIIDRTLMNLLDFDQETDLMLTVKGRQLIIEPLTEEERARKLSAVSKRLMTKNAELYRRLAK